MTGLHLRPAALLALVLLAGGCASQEVPFTVLTPSDTPHDATVVVHGEHSAFEGGIPLQPAPDGGYSGIVSLPANQEQSFTLALRLATGAELAELTGPLEPMTPRPLLRDADGEYQDVLTEVVRWEHPADPANPAVTFEVSVGVDHPAGAPVWVTGEAPTLGAWNPRGIRLYKRSDGKFVGQARVPAGTTSRFALTRGSWSTSERLADGSEAPLRTLTVGGEARTEVLTVERWLQSDKSKVLTGNIEYLRGMTSAHVSTRDVIIWLPPGYQEAGNTTRYPVLYMHDGQNLMDGSTSFAGEWHLDEVAQRLVQLGQLEPLIIIGVYNVGSHRISDYTPVPDPDYGGGNAAAYASYLVDELKPRIDADYRTLTDAASTGVAGSSLGGLVSMYLGLSRPETFTRLGVVSPSVWWANQEIVSRVQAQPEKLPLRVWLDIGTQEGSGETVPAARALRDALVGEGWLLEQDLFYLEVPGGVHNEASWAARADLILRALFPPQ